MLKYYKHSKCECAITEFVHHTITIKKQPIFSKKQKGFRDDLSYSIPQKNEETSRNAITQPWSHPIKKM